MTIGAVFLRTAAAGIQINPVAGDHHFHIRIICCLGFGQSQAGKESCQRTGTAEPDLPG